MLKTSGTDLKVFHDGTDWWVASDMDDLAAQWSNYYGGGVGIFQQDHAEYFAPLDLLEEITIIDDVYAPDDEQKKQTKTAAEWITEHGRGLLASTEW